MEPLGKGRALARSLLRLQRSAHRCLHRASSSARAASASAAAAGQESPAGILLRGPPGGRPVPAPPPGEHRGRQRAAGRSADGPLPAAGPPGPARLLLPVRPSATFI